MAVSTAGSSSGAQPRIGREVARGDEGPVAGEARGEGRGALQPVEPDGARAGGQVAAREVEGGGLARGRSATEGAPSGPGSAGRPWRTAKSRARSRMASGRSSAGRKSGEAPEGDAQPRERAAGRPA